MSDSIKLFTKIFSGPIIILLNEAYLGLDNGEVLLLLLLDFSAAFDVVEHPFLIFRLHSLGITGNALSWFQSYLSNRSETVSCANSFSTPGLVSCGVPLGSVLGPLLFSVYVNNVSSVIHPPHQCIIYADDIKLFMRSSPTNIPASIISLQRCVSDLKQWLDPSYLFLNSKKIVFTIFSRKSMADSTASTSIDVCGIDIFPKPVVRDLGILLDSALPRSSRLRS